MKLKEMDKKRSKRNFIHFWLRRFSKKNLYKDCFHHLIKTFFVIIARYQYKTTEFTYEFIGMNNTTPTLPYTSSKCRNLCLFRCYASYYNSIDLIVIYLYLLYKHIFVIENYIDHTNYA